MLLWRKEIVYIGTGHAIIQSCCFEALSEAKKKRYSIVRTSRVGNGITTQRGEYAKANIFAGDTLNVQKAAILLAVALTKTNDTATIQRIFDEILRCTCLTTNEVSRQAGRIAGCFIKRHTRSMAGVPFI